MFRSFDIQVEGTAYGFLSISEDVNYDLLNECFELGAFHGLRKPHPDDIVEAPKTPSPPPPAGTYISCLLKMCRLLTLLLLSTTCPVLANSVDPDQLASEEAN